MSSQMVTYGHLITCDSCKRCSLRVDLIDARTGMEIRLARTPLKGWLSFTIASADNLPVHICPNCRKSDPEKKKEAA